MTFKFNFQACGYLLCSVVFQQFFKMGDSKLSENSNNFLISFIATPMFMLFFGSNLPTCLTARAPALPVLVSGWRVNICAHIAGTGSGDSGWPPTPSPGAIPPRSLSSPITSAATMACTMVGRECVIPTNQGPGPGPLTSPHGTRLSPRHTRVCTGPSCQN